MRRSVARSWYLAGSCLSVFFVLNGEAAAAEPPSPAIVVQEPAAAPGDPEAVPATPLPAPSAPSPSAAPARATLGVQLLPLTAASDSYRSPVAEGALIGSIVAGSPADRAGLPLGGVIVAIDGRRVSSPADAVRIIHSVAPGQPVEVKYYDGSRLFRKTIQLAPSAFAGPMLPSPYSPEATLPPVPYQPPQRRAVREGIGRLLEQFAAPPPPSAALPTAPADDALPLDELRQQVEGLRRQVAELQARLAELEKKLAEQPPR